MATTHARTLAIALACLTALGLAGCAAGTTTPASPGAGAPAASSPSPGSATAGSTGQPDVPAALQFTAATVAGGTFDGATLAGKPAVLWFWAAWCPRCQAKASEVRAAQAASAARVNFVGVAGLGSGQEPMARFVAQHSLDAFPHLADDTGVVWRHFGVTEQEFFVLIDANGNIVHKGPLTTSELNQRIADLAR